MIRTALLSSVVLAALGATSAFAGTAATDAYVTNITQIKTVIAQADSYAAERGGEKLMAFAKGGMAAPSDLVASASDLPVTVASNLSVNPTEGRSASAFSIDMSAYQQPLGEGVSLQTEPFAITYLSRQQARSFDWTYKAVESDALTRLIGFYDAYSQMGDDPALRAEAIDQLPKAKARLADLQAL